MGILTSAIILILSTLILASLQLTPGVFILLSHYAHGKYSFKKANLLNLHFILGYATFLTATWLLFYSFTFFIFYNYPLSIQKLIIWILSGILIAESVITLFFYFKHNSSGTELFISRSIASKLEAHAKRSKNRSDAFALGFFAGIPELIFTTPIFFVSTIGLMNLETTSRTTTLICCIICSILPLIILHQFFRNDHNLATIERLRVRGKIILHLLISFYFLLLAIFLLTQESIYYG